jgi:hypothetical protein
MAADKFACPGEEDVVVRKWLIDHGLQTGTPSHDGKVIIMVIFHVPEWCRGALPRRQNPSNWPRVSAIQKILEIDAGLLQNGPQCSFGQITSMIGNGCISVGCGVIPDFMAPGGLTMKGKPKGF